MSAYLYQSLPKWILSSIRDRVCSQCETKYKKSDIVAVGIRQTKKQYSLYLEHECSSCKHRALTTVGQNSMQSLEDLCFGILENMRQKRIAAKSCSLKTPKEGKMTDHEVRKFLKFVRKAPTHDDVLREIGIPPKKEDDKS